MRDLEDGIWLKVHNARLEGERLELQLEGDRADREPRWWPAARKAAGENGPATFRALVDALDRKRIVLAKLGIFDPSAGPEDFALGSKPTRPFLGCGCVRIQLPESRLN